MNYIKRLEQENEEKAREIARLEEQRREIIRYLALPKFDQDPTVQKTDILSRLGAF